jgi:hypothetical protein
MISHKHKFIFVHIPKCAGSSIEQFLLRNEGVEVTVGEKFYLNSLSDNVKKEYLLDYPLHSYSQHFPLGRYSPKFVLNYYCFTFVRNPWDLLVSEYFYIIENYDIDFSFEEFIYLGKDIKNVEAFRWFVERGNHLKLQFTFLSKGIDFIGRFENLQDDFNIICDRIGIPQQDLPHGNKSNHKRYVEYYNDSTREVVAKRYAKDIEYFGYEFGE